MKEIIVLITAAGAGPAIAVIKALRKLPERYPGYAVKIHASDMSANAAGLYLADEKHLAPSYRDSNYSNYICEIAKKNNIQMIIPILDEEALVLSRQKDLFEKNHIVLAVNSEICIEKSNDKLQSFEVCKQAGINQPQRFANLEEITAKDFPLLIKPIQGVGSRDMFLCHSLEELLLRKELLNTALCQSFVTGEEYSIDTFGNPDTSIFVAVPRHRRVVKAGQMVQGSTVNDPELIEFAKKICRAFKATNVCNIQVIRDKSDRIFFIEINPRYGTGISLSIASGVPFPLLQWLSASEPDQIRPEMLKFQAGLEMIRYWDEIFIVQ